MIFCFKKNLSLGHIKMRIGWIRDKAYKTFNKNYIFSMQKQEKKFKTSKELDKK